MEEEGESVRSDRARREFRTLLNRVEHGGEHVTILRYQTPAAVIVPVGWHAAAVAAIGDCETGQESPDAG